MRCILLGLPHFNGAAVANRGGTAGWADAYFGCLAERTASILTVPWIAAANVLKVLLALLFCHPAAFFCLALPFALSSLLLFIGAALLLDARLLSTALFGLGAFTLFYFSTGCFGGSSLSFSLPSCFDLGFAPFFGSNSRPALFLPAGGFGFIGEALGF
jgi:hypothetical protein